LECRRVADKPTYAIEFIQCARGSTLKGDQNYTSDTVFDTFPWPQTPTRVQVESVAKAAVALRQLHRDVMAKMNWSLRDIYRTLEEPGANPLRDTQARLGESVRAAYGMASDADILAFLLDLNGACAAREAAEAASLPRPPVDHAAFITTIASGCNPETLVTSEPWQDRHSDLQAVTGGSVVSDQIKG